MNDNMTDIFRDRFHGYESPVDPGIWAGIKQQMASGAPAAGEDGVSKLFKERFQGHGTSVDPSVWQGISAQLGHGVAAGTGFGLLGWAATGALAIVVGVASFMLMDDTVTEIPNGPVAEVMVPLAEPTTEALSIIPISKAPDEQPVATTIAVEKKHDVLVASTPKVEPKNDQTIVAPAPLQRTVVPQPGTSAQKAMVVPEPQVVPTVIDAPAKVEQIIRDLTNEVQMEVLTKGEQRAVQVDPNAGNEQELAEYIEERDPAPLPKLFMPNTFTPNGDGVNDTYTLSGIGYRSIMMRVYSMKNDQLVFSTNHGEPWTGNNCEDGMYMVAVEAITEDGRTLTEGKVVWLTRVRLN